MAALDTNLLVRYLVRDDETQLEAVTELLRSCIQHGVPLFVPITVALELEWVLRSRYALDKSQVCAALADLLSTEELYFESENALEVALAIYRAHRTDFSDCMHVALAVQAGERPLWTFDQAAAKVDGARLLR